MLSYLQLFVDELPLRLAAILAFIRADDMRLAGKLFCDANDCTTPDEAFIDWRRADCNCIF